MPQETPKPVVEVSFQLPICLHLDSTVVFKFADEEIDLQTDEVLEEHDSRFGSGKGVEIKSDIEGAFRFTRIKIRIKDDEPEIPVDRLMKLHEKRILACVNTFIDAYRYITGRHSIANIQSLQSCRAYNVYRTGGDRKSIGLYAVTFGGPGSALTTHLPLRSKEEHNRLQDHITLNSLPLEDLFMMDAWRQVRIGHDLQALISANTALELAMPHSAVGKVRKIIGLFRRERPFQVSVRQTLQQRGVDSKTIDLVVGAIRDRNRIIHEGLRKLSGGAEQYLKAIEDAIILTT